MPSQGTRVMGKLSLAAEGPLGPLGDGSLGERSKPTGFPPSEPVRTSHQPPYPHTTNGTAIFAYIGVVLGVNVGVYIYI